MTSALQLDADNQPEQAVSAYEALIEAGQADRRIYANLIALYYCATDMGFVAAHHLSNDIVNRAYPRSQQLLDEAEVSFAGDHEFKFWRLFLGERVAGETVPDSAYETLAREGCTLAYIPLYGRTRGRQRQYKAEVDRLLEQTAADSARNRFILSYAPTRTFPDEV